MGSSMLTLDHLDLDEMRSSVDSVLEAFLAEKSTTAADGCFPPEAIEIFRDFLRSGGKRMRPLLCLVGWHAAAESAETEKVLRIAASLEMFHAFTLIHDDVMDNSSTRRGKPTVHRAFAHRYAARPDAMEFDLPRLDHCRRVLTEALRLYPPVWAVSRTTTSETELAGQTLAKNTTVMWSPYLLHRNADLYAAPDDFDPDRWPVGHNPTDSRGAMFPFAAGRRKCIGDNFAIVEATLALATIASSWRLSRPDGTRLVPEPKMTLGTGLLPMVCTSRSPQLASSN